MNRKHDLLLGESQTTLKKLRKAKEAYKAAWFYIWIGLAVGFALVGIEHLVDDVILGIKFFTERDWAKYPLQVVAFILGHLGIGFIVSSIAVFFYEWGAHIKETVELSGRLVGSLNQVRSMMEALNLNQNLKDLNVAHAKQRLPYCIHSLIGGIDRNDKEDHLLTAAEQCEKLVLAISNLWEKKTWANDQYIKFIANHLKEFVVHNAEAFSNLPNGLQIFHVPPTAAQMADEVLTLQMQAMGNGDIYAVISDLASWQGRQLENLFSETRVSIEERDVQIKRVFNMLPYIDPSTNIPGRIRETLQKHLAASRTWKGRTAAAKYEIKFLWPEGAKLLRSKHAYNPDDIRKLHFGLFIHSLDNGKEVVRFTVTEPDLSDMLGHAQ